MKWKPSPSWYMYWCLRSSTKARSTCSVVLKRSASFTPSAIRRTSIWVTGGPLPGWIFSVETMTPSLPSISTMLPFRSELAMTFTGSSAVGLSFGAHHTDLEPDRHIFPCISSWISDHKAMAKTPTIAPAASPFWAPHVHADRRPFLLARNRIVAVLRAWFAAHDFVEVDTGALQVSPGNETHLHAFNTTLAGPDGASSQLYLRTSPEFACKKLLAA